MKKIVCIVLCLVTLLTLSAPAFAVNQSRAVIGAD